MGDSWPDEFARRMRGFSEPFPGSGLPVSVKVRVVSGCFHREDSPHAYGLIDAALREPALERERDTIRWHEHRGLPALLRKLEGAKLRFAITGSLAATRRAPIGPPRLASLYVDDPVVAAEALELSVVESGGNVMLAQPLDNVAFERTWTDSGLCYAALSQVAADLLKSPGRGPAEGEELLAWMKAKSGVWRA